MCEYDFCSDDPGGLSLSFMYTHPICIHIQSLLLDEWSRQYQYFQLIGVLCGMVIYNAVIVNLPFPTALYKKLLKRFAVVNLLLD